MGSVDQDYPDYLNPFDDSDNEQGDVNNKVNKSVAIDSKSEEYPDYLSPFGDEETTGTETATANHGESKADDYDDSLNPFGDEENNSNAIEHCNDIALPQPVVNLDVSGTEEKDRAPGNESNEKTQVPTQTTQSATTIVTITPASNSKQPEESPGPPPVPLPRTRSLLKKEQALRNKQHASELDNNQKSPKSISENPNSLTRNNSTTDNNEGSFQRKKNKRNAPPLPVNYKRQVSGSAEAIEEELNGIGDRLAELEIESNTCQSDLKRSYQVNETEFAIARAKFVEIIRMKNSISRRQKELMYRKREITLDQDHSDIEYELRMIGNKQSSNQTPEDDTRERELLKKLVEIVEEKNDIVENLNRDTSCDIEDVEEALRRMNLLNSSPLKSVPNEEQKSGSLEVHKQKDSSCFKSNNLVSGAKLSKIATLLPKSGTLKGTMKLKRKRLFKKSSQIQ